MAFPFHRKGPSLPRPDSDSSMSRAHLLDYDTDSSVRPLYLIEHRLRNL